MITTCKNAVWLLCKAGVDKRCIAESVSDCMLNGFHVNRPYEDSFSISSFFSPSGILLPFPAQFDVFVHRQGHPCLYCTVQFAAVNLQGLADQADLENN